MGSEMCIRDSLSCVCVAYLLFFSQVWASKPTLDKKVTRTNFACLELTIGIDIGHSVRRGGATSASGRKEYEFNRDLAVVLLERLRKLKAKAFIVETKGRTLALKERARRAAAKGATLLVSVHHDSVQPRYLKTRRHKGVTQRYSEKFSGFSVFVSAKNSHYLESLEFATAISRRLMSEKFKPTLHHAEAIPGENRTLLDPRLGLYRFDGLGILRSASMPALLLEAGVIVHPKEEQRLRARAYQTAFANAVAHGILKTCSTATSSASKATGD